MKKQMRKVGKTNYFYQIGNYDLYALKDNVYYFQKSFLTLHNLKHTVKIRERKYGENILWKV